MEHKTIHSLGEILISLPDPKWQDFLFCETGRPFNVSTKCITLTQNEMGELEEEGKNPELVELQDLTFKWILGIQEVEDICSNARNQKLKITAEDLLKAFIYYHENDAFIEFNEDTTLK